MANKEKIEETVEEMTQPESFDLLDVLEKKVTYPTDEVVIGVDAHLGAQAEKIANEIADLQFLADESTDGTIANNAGAEYQQRAEELTEELEAIIDQINESAMTVTLRGVAPKVWRLIDKEWRRKIPTSKNDNEASTMEKNIERNEGVNLEVVRRSITKIELGDGRVREGNPSEAEVKALYDSLLETEWEKLKDATENLTFSNTVFEAKMKDADFLSKSSAGNATEDTSD